ncbi:hypothetical protein MGN70_011905 [Eutypa lata]|nr:hypothetical protein MGN70_011905 [Eutypa lata]
MNKFLQSILVALLVPPAVGWDPSQRDCSDIPLCLTSFKWCDSKGDEGCYFPDGVYKPSLAPGNVIYALVLENRNYTISWKVYPNNQDIPVRVQWPLGENATWETNTTDSQIIFNPYVILNSFPLSSVPNLSVAEAEYHAKKDVGNVISISQPDLKEEDEPDFPLNQPYDSTDQFIVGSSWTERFLETENSVGHSDEYNKWKLGVGIGTGLGIPILMVGTALVTWMILRKRMVKPPLLDK